MKCPACETTDLILSERTGIEIDYCPKCRGVWLDRGELDKIIERSMSDPRMDVRRQLHEAPPAPGFDGRPERATAGRAGYQRDPDTSEPGFGYERGHPDQRGGKRRKGWFGELFDVFD
jgi:Zn-finger nucleic acid-binding protein